MEARDGEPEELPVEGLLPQPAGYDPRFALKHEALVRSMNI